MELRAKREEEERKRREEKRRQQQQQQEEQKRRQEEEELFRRKQVGAQLGLPRWAGARGGHALSPRLPVSHRVSPRLPASPRVSPLQVRQQELLLKLLQQQQAAAAVPASPAPSSPPPLWAGLAKQGLSMKTLLELQLEGERQLHKQPPPREPSRAQAPNHRVVSRRAGPSPTGRSAGLEPSGTPPSSYSSQGDRGWGEQGEGWLSPRHRPDSEGSRFWAALTLPRSAT